MDGESWTPPEGMAPKLIAEWRSFYSAISTKYGLSPTDYRDLYVAQYGTCFICRKAKGKHPDDPKGRGGRRLGVDHNHALGNRRVAVRGLLCTGGPNTCNRIIGWLNHVQLQRAVNYLEYPPAQRVFRHLDRTPVGSIPALGWDREEQLKRVLGLETKR